MSPFDDFFRDVDRSWSLARAAKVPLRVIGSAALMLQTRYRRRTKDGDVLETTSLDEDAKDHLRSIAGPGTLLHAQHRLYLDIVRSGIPFLPQRPRCHLLPQLNATMAHIQLEVLDTVDVVVSKLKRFSASDIGDIQAMIDLGKVDHGDLVSRFRDAVDLFTLDAQADDLPVIVRHFHRVERDYFGVKPTEIELPDWIA
jgi:hypothetical protein